MIKGIVCAALLVACGGGSATPDAGVPDARLEGFDRPDLVCPGDPSCASTGDGQLKVGAAKRVYTPQDFETFTDENGDKKYEASEPFVDKNGNGKFDGVWLFGGSRAAMGVTTDVEARAIAFVEGDVTVVICYIDAIGVLSGDMDRIRTDPSLAGLGIDHVVIGATHAHDAPDLVGLWGPDVGTTGRQKFVVDGMVAAAVAAIKEAVTSAQPAQMVIATSLLINDPANPMSRTDDFNKDIRDPVIFDPTLTVARFVKASDPTATIGTLVNWADHPEVAHFSDADPATITAHYPHYLREHIETGVTAAQSKYAATDLAGLGGVTVFVQGALGGQIGSIRGTHPPGPGGVPVTIESDAMEQALGTNAAAKALTALKATGETVSDLPLSFKTATFDARVENTLFHVAIILKILAPHPIAGYNVDAPIDADNLPWMPLRSTYVQIGPLGIVTAPGELHPELWVGGYDGSWSWGWALLEHAGSCADTHADCSTRVPCAAGVACVPTPNLPMFDQAPKGPYMRDLVKAHAGVRYPVLAGLAEDYIGYIVPAYNYALDPDNPYINEAVGDHYEEVYSVGPLVEQHAIHPILELLRYRR